MSHTLVKPSTLGLAGVIVLVAWVGYCVGAELLRDRIYPFDSALQGANGAFFYTLLRDLPAFFSSPVDWLWDYYNQYPALSVRRYPPLFGALLGVLYLGTGVSIFGAKLLVFAFAVVFVIGTFKLADWLYRDRLVAIAATLLLASVPAVTAYYRSVWLDIPMLAFTVWAYVFYVRRMERDPDSWRAFIPVVVFALMALYTYQLALFPIAALGIFWLVTEGKLLWQRKAVLVLAIAFVVIALPIAVQALYLGRDNLLAATGGVPEGWDRFVPVQGAEAWTYYLRTLARFFPFVAIGLVLWIGLRSWRRPGRTELLFLLWLVLAYIGFSIISGKVVRYGVHLAVPASILAVFGYREAVQLLFRDPLWRSAGLAAVLLVMSTVQAFAFKWVPEYYYTSGMGEVVGAILEENPAPSILYSGRYDAAFVFYMRKSDAERRAQIARATVQLEDPARVNEFLEEREIDTVAIEEVDAEPGLSIYDDFRDALERSIESRGDFRLVGRYVLNSGIDDEQFDRQVALYTRNETIGM